MTFTTLAIIGGVWLALIVLLLRFFYCASPRRED